MRATQTGLLSAQWFLFILANTVAVPVALAPALGLDAVETAGLVQRTFFISGLVTVLQALFGHRLPIVECSGSMWIGVFVAMGAMASALGWSQQELLSMLALAVFSGGVASFVLGATGLVSRITSLFSPPITGTFLILLALQVGGFFFPGMLGVTAEHPTVDLRVVLVSVVTVAGIVGVTLYTKGVLRSIGLLFGIALGWLLAILLGRFTGAGVTTDTWFYVPRFLSWGLSEWNTGVILTGVMTGVLVLSNGITSVVVMSRLSGRDPMAKDFNGGASYTGVADMLGGLFGTAGYAPFTASASLVSIIAVPSVVPMIFGGLGMLFMGLIPPIGQLVALLPPPVAYAAVIGMLSQLFVIGVQDYHRWKLDSRGTFVIGVAVVFGLGITQVSPSAFTEMPRLLQYILGNGMMVGLLLAILLEYVILPKPREKRVSEDTAEPSPP